MFRRKRKGKSVGNYYYWHPVTGRRKTTETDDRVLAKAIVAKAEREAVERKAGIFVPKFSDQCDTWLELNRSLTSKRRQRMQGLFWKKHLGGTPLNQVTKELVHDIMRQNRPITLDSGSKANNTANTYVRFVAKIIRAGGVTVPDFHLYPKSQKSKRWLRPEEWVRLKAIMRDDLRHAATFSLATGLRHANVTGFQWSWIHGDKAYLPREVTKTDEEYGIPLNRAALQAIAERKAAAVRHPQFVFLNGGRTWNPTTYYRALRDAATEAGIDGLNVHALRHTFASWLLQLEVPDSARKRLGCWSIGSDAASGYAHFDVEPLRKHAEKLDPLILTSVSPDSQVVELSGNTLAA